jgi:hypothetical protein
MLFANRTRFDYEQSHWLENQKQTVGGILLKDKILDLNKTVYELCSGDSGITKLLEAVGFRDIANPGMLATAGRFMTIPKGAKMKNFNLEAIKQTFEEHGYKIKEESA